MRSEKVDVVSAAALAVQLVVNLGCAILYAWVGQLVLARKVAPDSRLANAFFGAWWYGIAAVFLLVAAYQGAVRLARFQDLALAVTLVNVLLSLVVLAAGGLVAYLTFLFSGRKAYLFLVVVFYVFVEVLFLYLVAWLRPNGFDATGALTYARPQPTGGLAITVGLLYSLPVVLATLAYGSLFFRTKQPHARYRVGLVAGGFLLQFGWAVLSNLLQLPRRFPDSNVLPIVGDALAILAAGAVLLAFHPPAWVERRIARAATRSPRGG